MFFIDETKISDSASIPLPGEDILMVVRRLDLPDDITAGNKWFKLKYNLETAVSQNKSHIITFGGAFSNHIAATARACKIAGLNCTGIIRGESTSITNPTLSRAARDGMKFHFVSRDAYRNKEKIISNLQHDSASTMILPEGGSNDMAAKGCSEIIKETDQFYTHFAVCCGTGCTASGIASKLLTHQQLIGFNVVKAMPSISDFISAFAGKQQMERVILTNEFDFGGYARTALQLDVFIKFLNDEYRIPSEPIYTGKMFYGLFEMAKKGNFRKGDRILAIHTGGMQYLSESETH